MNSNHHHSQTQRKLRVFFLFSYFLYLGPASAACPMETSRLYNIETEELNINNTLATYKINVCNIKKHILDIKVRGRKSCRNIISLFHATFVQKFMQLGNKAIATSRNHRCNIIKSQLQHTRRYLPNRALPAESSTRSITKSHHNNTRCSIQHASEFLDPQRNGRG